MTVIVQTGLPCSCEYMEEPCKCKGCDTVFCFKCQVAFICSAGFYERHLKIRCCPECYSDNLIMLNEKRVSTKQDQEHSQEAKSRPNDVSSFE